MPSSRRDRAINRGVMAGSVLVLAAALLPVPYVIMSPGPVFNTIGEYQGRPVIEISGTKTFPTEGNLDMTTVSERGGSSGGVSTAEVLLALMRDNQAVLPRDALYPPQESGEEIRAANTQSFATSQSDAVGAALRELDIPAIESVVAAEVAGGSPADGIVRAGDIITKVNGKAVDSPKEVVNTVRATEVGDTVNLTVSRSDEKGKATTEELKVVTAAHPDPDRGGVSYLGVSVTTLYEAPFDIDFTLDTVGGPSAGMMFSLAIIDKLTDGQLTGGNHVAGTGTISPDGNVGPIGGIRHKLAGAADAGAKLFLAPQANCNEVVGAVPEGLQVVPVQTLHEARQVIEKWVADPTTPLPSCQAQ